MVGEDPQRAVGLERLAVLLAAELLTERDQRRELVGLEHRLRALQDRGHAVESHAGVDVLRGQRRERVDRVLVELHEHEVPVLEEALVLAARQVVGRAELEPVTCTCLSRADRRASSMRCRDSMTANNIWNEFYG